MKTLIFIIVIHYVIFFADKAMANQTQNDCFIMSATTRALVHVKKFVSAKYDKEMSRDDMQDYIEAFYVDGEMNDYAKAVRSANWVYENLGKFNNAKQAQEIYLNECLSLTA